MIGTSVPRFARSIKRAKDFLASCLLNKIDHGPSANPLAFSRAIGARARAIPSAREETAMDLFAEQALWPNIIMLFREGFSVLKEVGCSNDALCHEIRISKESAEIFDCAAEDGFT
ncbi:hypothetical protein PILCRDRAFT_817145 [Piloderma croceum F 1598]|uniref:KARI C-terminal knotted domain-containing protein n=1 Tax=Piloderma croceum (strain F 1598) TaxID=765440 RepID=A0A0C3FM80_PILCF|nr:hypothetical protein PILCRDRAFT_817145 [Piloderma croceum F 1598]